jgi:hypothetical protein
MAIGKQVDYQKFLALQALAYLIPAKKQVGFERIAGFAENRGIKNEFLLKNLALLISNCSGVKHSRLYRWKIIVLQGTVRKHSFK